MKEWTLEERYRVLNSPDDIKDLYERISRSWYRQKYHIQPVTGLSSDPNGFAYHNGEWHLFYQWCPWGAVHGLKYWYHVVSKDLISWRNAGVGLKPDSFYDNKGTHSGSAISHGDDLYFFYTGNHRDENWVRTPYTCAARLVDGKPIKLDEPLFGPRDDYSEHQRDPKIVYNKEKDEYFIFIGAQTSDEKGTILVYKSKSLLEGWEFAGQIKVPGYESFGGMWECPSLERVNGRDILIFSPQYTTLPNRGNSTNHNVYFIGQMDYDTLTFHPDGDYHYLDYGFDFYAAQTAANVNKDDHAIMIAWIGLPDNHYPTEPEEWEGSMCLPRQLTITDDGRLIQTPIPEIKDLRDGEFNEEGVLSDICELEVQFAGGDADLNLFTKEDGSGGFTIHYNSAEKTCTIDRTGMDKRFNENVFEVLDMPLENELKSFNIYIDRSSIEIFVNGGEATFTSHIYPTDSEHGYTKTDNITIKQYRMKSSVVDDFVI